MTNLSLFLTQLMLYKFSVQQSLRWAAKTSERLAGMFYIYKTRITLSCVFLLYWLPSVSLALTPIAADKAFVLTAKTAPDNTAVLNWSIHPGYQLYRQRIHVRLKQPRQAKLGVILMPNGHKKYNQWLGHYEVYTDKVAIAVPIIFSHRLDDKKTPVVLTVNYQGCSQSGYCYPPVNRQVHVNFAEHTAAVLEGKHRSVLSNAEGVLASHSLWLVISGFFLLGLLLTMTPCVWPMVPIVATIVLGQSHKPVRRPVRLTLMYVLGMATSYAVLGGVIAALGTNLQVLLQTPWVIVPTSFVLFILALSLLGAYDLRLPKRLQEKLNTFNQQPKKGTYLGVMMMGALSTLVISPCVTPPLVAALGYVAHHGELMTGVFALFSLGWGMGLPLLVFAAAGPKWLPKSGAWLKGISYCFGFIMLGIAVWLLDRLLPVHVMLVLWALWSLSIAAMLIWTSISSVSFRRTIRCTLSTLDLKRWVSLTTGTFFLLNALSLVYLVARRAEVLWPMPWSSVTYALNQHKPQAHFRRVNSVDDLNKALMKAHKVGQPSVLDFYAKWCVSCQILQAHTFKAPNVRLLLNKVNRLKADVTNNNSHDRALMKHYQIVAPPVILFFDTQGVECTDLRLIGEIDAKQLAAHLKRLLKGTMAKRI